MHKNNQLPVCLSVCLPDCGTSYSLNQQNMCSSSPGCKPLVFHSFPFICMHVRMYILYMLLLSLPSNFRLFCLVVWATALPILKFLLRATKTSWRLGEGDESDFLECVKDFHLLITQFNKLFEFFLLYILKWTLFFIVSLF